MAERTFIVTLGDGIPATHVEAALAVEVPDQILAAWRSLAEGSVDSGAYMAALNEPHALQYPYLGDAMVVGLVNTAEHADWIENGRGGFHLPSRWGAGGGQWKINAEGRRYATVTFRHGTPLSRGGGTSTKRGRLGNAMPAAVYARARKLKSGQRLSGFGDDYKQSKSYFYFRQIFGELPSELDGADSYTWVASPYEGMLRTTAATPARGRHTEYRTFRTISEDSPAWYIPPTPARRFAERALEQAAPVIDDILNAAAARDAMAALASIGEGL